MRKTFVVLSLFATVLISLPAFALPGELAAVERHCGNPSGESREVSPVTNRTERTLIYNDLLLHFQPEETGWSFTTGWHGHFPVTRNELEKRLPCFRDAMNEVAASTPANALAPADPAVAQQTAVPPAQDNSFGIPHFWLIVILAATLIVFILIPSATARRRKKAALEAEIDRNYRKPDLDAAAPVTRNKHIDPDLYQ